VFSLGLGLMIVGKAKWIWGVECHFRLLLLIKCVRSVASIVRSTSIIGIVKNARLGTVKKLSAGESKQEKA
jgi:hypothetical protein